MLRKPFNLGGITLPSNVFCSPLAGCSDLPFRQITKGYAPGLIYCEMVKMDALIRHDPNTYRLLDYDTGMHPIGAQLCGSKPEYAGSCAKICEDLGFDVIDLNCGCPVDKVTKDGSGSGLLKQPQRIGEIISNMAAAVKVPVTVKVRAGWDSESINCIEVAKIAKEAGAAAICIHGRTRSQGYKGPAIWDYIRECKEAVPDFCVIGNGDIFDAKSAERIFTETGCDGIMLSRGTFGQPWLIEDIYRHLEGLPPLSRDSLYHRDCLIRHMDIIASYQIERRALLDMRRVGCWYLKYGAGTRRLRELINGAKSMREIRSLIEAFPWHETDFSVKSSTEEVYDLVRN